MGNVEGYPWSLPATLNGQYAQILGNIHTNHRKLAVKAFQWVIHSKFPIYVDELVDVLAIDVAAKPRFRPKRRLIDQDDLFRNCSNLIDVSPRLRLGDKREQDSVRFAHLPVKEYLLSYQLFATPVGDFAPSHPNAHTIIARDCLSYLLHVNDSYGVEAKNLAILGYFVRESFAGFHVPEELHTRHPCSYDAFRKWWEEVIEPEEGLRAALPLVFYAAEYWAYHARIAGEQDSGLFQLMIEAFEPCTFKTWSSFVDLGWNEYREPRNVFTRPPPDRLTYAIDKQLIRLVEHLHRQGVDVSTEGSEGLAPLQVAGCTC
ncbi:MAG: hypothetical protein Q9198_005899 [Flavoplaca austrocitrina]